MRNTLELGLLDQLPLAVVITTQDGKIAYWNRGAEALYGWPRRDVMRRPLAALSAPGRAPDALREALESVTSGGQWAGHVSLRHRSGAHVPADLRCSPLLNADEETIGVIVAAVETPSRDRRASDTAEGVAQVGRRIARARKEAGLTQQELAERVGVTRRSIQGYESGSVAPYRHLDQLGAALGRSPQWLVSEQPEPGVTPELKAELRVLVREQLLETLTA